MEREINEILKMAKDKTIRKAADELLLQPFHYVQQIMGRHFRSDLSLAFNFWLDIPTDKCEIIEELTYMLHCASFLIDDIEDNSTVRKGHPVAHSIYGVGSCINAANYVYFLAYEKAYQLGHQDAPKILLEELLDLHRGQGMDIYWRDNFICPTEKDYKLMTIKKMGGVFMLPIRLMQLFSENKKDYSLLGALLSLYYQISDDYCNSSLKWHPAEKGFAEDLSEGKFSFPIMHAVSKQKGDLKIMHILRQRTQDIEMKKYCISQMENLGSFDYTRKVLESIDKEAREEVQRLGGNPHLEKLFDKLQFTWTTKCDSALASSK